MNGRRWAQAQAWSKLTGRPLPPQMRERIPLTKPVPLGPQDRWNRYTRANHADRLTPAQTGRFRHKHGRRMLDVYMSHLR